MKIPRVGQTWLWQGVRPVTLTRISRGLMPGTYSLTEAPQCYRTCLWVTGTPLCPPRTVRAFLSNFKPV